jgi:hypothetical protein
MTRLPLASLSDEDGVTTLTIHLGWRQLLLLATSLFLAALIASLGAALA